MERKYLDLYDPGWAVRAYDDAAAALQDPDGTVHHPIVNGAFYEDQTAPLPVFYHSFFVSDPAYAADPNYYWDQAGYYRDYHHFGGEATGLEHRWYFSLRGNPPTSQLVNGRYYSARDWGHGGARIDETLNRLTFVRAIEQYNRYSFDGKRAAYLMLGHVVHLLQDQGQPDHARLVAHPGSSMTEDHAYSTYHYCEFLAGEAAAAAALACFGPWSWACAAAAFAATLAGCKLSADSDVVGYERLIGSHWSLSAAEPGIGARGVVRKGTYDEYFQSLAAYAKSQADQRGLSSALGCDTLILIPPIPGADPAIDTTTDEPAAYADLTNALVPEVVGMTAGLIQHFFEVVNHPPILERLTVVQVGA